MQKVLGIDFTMFGFGVPSDNLHSPNERCTAKLLLLCRMAAARHLENLTDLTSARRFPVAMYEKGIHAYVKLLGELGAVAAQSAQEEL